MKYYLLSTEEMAKHIGVNTQTLRNLLMQHDIPSQVVKGKRLFHPFTIHLINDIRETNKTTTKPDEKAMRVPVKPDDPYLKRECSAMAEIKGEFPSSLLSDICRDVVLQAVDDLNSTEKFRAEEAKTYKSLNVADDAREYFSHDIIPHAELVGVESEWIHRVLKDYYLL